MAFIFRIKRRPADSPLPAGPPDHLEPGELAFDEKSNCLYIGTEPCSGVNGLSGSNVQQVL